MKQRHIRVVTHPNGYALTIENKEYMYFSEKELAEGIFHHIMLGCKRDADKNMLHNLTTAAAMWVDIKDNAQAIADVMTAKDDTHEKLMIANHYVSKANNRIDELEATVDELRAKMQIDSYKAAQYDNMRRERDEYYSKYVHQRNKADSAEKHLSDLLKELKKASVKERKRKSTKSIHVSDEKHS